METKECPSCKNGKILAFPPVRKSVTGKLVKIPPIDCPDCNATGEIDTEPEWQSIGNKLSDIRRNARITLRSFCMDNDLDPQYVSQVERGLKKADGKLLNIYDNIESAKQQRKSS